LSPSEVNEYIKRRLGLVGYHEDGPFSSDALTLIAKWSGGVPARINGLCFSVLAAADRSENEPFDVSSVRKAIAIMEDLSSPAGGIRAYAVSPQVRWLARAVTIALFMTFTTVFSYQWLISIPTASAKHVASALPPARSVFSNSPAMEVVSEAPAAESADAEAAAAESADAETPGHSVESGRGAEQIVVPSGSGKLDNFETKIVPMDSESQPANARSINIVSEIRRGNYFMRKGQYEEAIRAFDAALELGADRRDVSGKIGRARRAAAAERRVLQ
jgi:tetratricopeptide (TPR) repeat protein